MERLPPWSRPCSLEAPPVWSSSARGAPSPAAVPHPCCINVYVNVISFFGRIMMLGGYIVPQDLSASRFSGRRTTGGRGPATMSDRRCRSEGARRTGIPSGLVRAGGACGRGRRGSGIPQRIGGSGTDNLNSSPSKPTHNDVKDLSTLDLRVPCVEIPTVLS